jgi:predicted phage tail protein
MNDGADSRDRSLWLAALGGLALVLCCAGPALVAGGLLSTVGTAISNGFVTALGLAMIAGGVVFTVARRRRACGSDDRRADHHSHEP